MRPESSNIHVLVQLLSICTLWYSAIVVRCYFTLQKHAEDAGVSGDVMLAGQSWHPSSFLRRAMRGQAREHSGSPREDGLSACLLVNHENARLPEWLAYHYHTLPPLSSWLPTPSAELRPSPCLTPSRQLLATWTSHSGLAKSTTCLLTGGWEHATPAIRSTAACGSTGSASRTSP